MEKLNHSRSRQRLHNCMYIARVLNFKRISEEEVFAASQCCKNQPVCLSPDAACAAHAQPFLIIAECFNAAAVDYWYCTLSSFGDDRDFCCDSLQKLLPLMLMLLHLQQQKRSLFAHFVLLVDLLLFYLDAHLNLE